MSKHRIHLRARFRHASDSKQHRQRLEKLTTQFGLSYLLVLFGCGKTCCRDLLRGDRQYGWRAIWPSYNIPSYYWRLTSKRWCLGKKKPSYPVGLFAPILFFGSLSWPPCFWHYKNWHFFAVVASTLGLPLQANFFWVSLEAGPLSEKLPIFLGRFGLQLIYLFQLF